MFAMSDKTKYITLFPAQSNLLGSLRKDDGDGYENVT